MVGCAGLRRWVWVVWVCALSVAAGCASQPVAQAPARSVGDEVALAHGYGAFEQVEAVAWTFRAKLGEREVARSWRWEPWTGEVWYEGPGDDGATVKVRYNRAQSGAMDEATRAIDARFINDRYWLLFPFHLVWDRDSATIEEVSASDPMPLGGGSARHIKIAYPADGGGYTPGDVYHAWVDAEGKLMQWAFHRGGAAEPSRVVLWEGYQTFGPLEIALEHRSSPNATNGGGFRLWFTDVEVVTRR